MSVYQKDITRIFKSLLLTYETRIAFQSKQDLKLDRFSIVELTVLEMLRGSEDIKQNTILERFEMKRSKVLGLIKKLIEAGYIEKKPDEEDKRSTYLTLTKAGNKLLDVYDGHEANFLDFILKDMTVNEEKAIVKFLSKINQTDYMK